MSKLFRIRSDGNWLERIIWRSHAFYYRRVKEQAVPLMTNICDVTHHWGNLLWWGLGRRLPGMKYLRWWHLLAVASVLLLPRFWSLIVMLVLLIVAMGIPVVLILALGFVYIPVIGLRLIGQDEDKSAFYISAIVVLHIVVFIILLPRVWGIEVRAFTPIQMAMGLVLYTLGAADLLIGTMSVVALASKPIGSVTNTAGDLITASIRGIKDRTCVLVKFDMPKSKREEIASDSSGR